MAKGLPVGSEDGDSWCNLNAGSAACISTALFPRNRVHVRMVQVTVVDTDLFKRRLYIYIYIYIYAPMNVVGRDSVAGIASRYGLNGPGLESPWG